MKVIFLDFDGVLNSAKYLLRYGDYGVVIDPAKMVLLKQIVDATAAKIVLSTSWREHWSRDVAQCDSTGLEICEIFEAYGLQIWDKTPQLRTRREAEIKSWLDQHPEVTGFVVLDDRLLGADYLTGHHVKTANHLDGLDEADTQMAINILKEVGI